jgi:1-phosphofructokinase family hexose kinase
MSPIDGVILLCITPNPALDRTLTVRDFALGGVSRTGDVLLAAGGKGLNVARAARTLGAEVLCLGILAGHTGRLFAELAEREGLPSAWTWGEGETRCATIIVSEGGATVVNEQGATIQAEVWEQFTSDVLTHSGESDVICVSGSYPPGVSVDHQTKWFRAMAESGKPVWIDSSGMALGAALETRGINLKVNGDEIGAALRRTVTDVASAADAASRARKRTRGTVVVTLGKLGAVMVTTEGRYAAKPPDIPIKSDVGSGDSFLAALAITGATPDGLRRAVAAGTANALSVGGGQFTVLDFDFVLAGTTVSAV